MTKALCIHDIKGVSEDQLHDAVRKGSALDNPRLIDVFYNIDQGKAFFEWEASDLDTISRGHVALGLKACPELLPVTEMKPGQVM